jgi:hypothetical protein
LRIPGPLSLIILLLTFLPVSAHGPQKKTGQAPQKKSEQQQKKPEENAQPKQQHENSTAAQQPGTNVQLAGDVRLSSGAVLHLEQFRATSISRLSDTGCKEQTLQIHSGRMSLTDAGLTTLINDHFRKQGNNKHMKVTADGDKLKFEGDKAGGMSMTFEARPAPLGDSRIKLVATDVKMEHLPVKGLMHVFGLNMDDLMHPKSPMLAVEKDDLILDLRYVAKNPHLEGDVRSVVIQGHRITLTFGPPARALAQVRPAKLKAKPVK